MPWIRAALATLLVTGCRGPGEPTPVAPSPPSRVAIASDPDAPALALALAVPGSAGELPGTEGLTYLTALTLLQSARPGLDSLGARVAIRCRPAVFTFTLVAARDVWQPAMDRFLDALFRPSPSDDDLERARADLRTSLSLDQASPAWQAHLALRRALFGDTLSTSWTAPACGVPEILSLFDLARVKAAAHRFAPRGAYAAAVTPDAPVAVREALEAWMAPGAAPPFPAPRAVTDGEVHVERRTVTAWTAVAFPFGPDADIEALHLLGAILEDGVGPGVDRPESFLASHEVEVHAAGGILVIRVVTAPDAAMDYAREIEDRVAGIAQGRLPDAIFRRVARKHRGTRLLERAHPEARAAAMASALALGRPPGDGWPDPDVTPERLRAAAGALAPPAVATVGARADSP